jgi:hypothetical protein
MSTRPEWVLTNQTRNYIVTNRAYEGRDVLHLWARVEEADDAANLYWARAGGGDVSG